MTRIRSRRFDTGTFRHWKMKEPGRIRVKLARLLEELFPEYTFDPSELYKTAPVFLSMKWCCTWEGYGRIRNGTAGKLVQSYSTMTKCVQHGISKVSDSEVCHNSGPATSTD